MENLFDSSEAHEERLLAPLRIMLTESSLSASDQNLLCCLIATAVKKNEETANQGKELYSFIKKKEQENLLSINSFAVPKTVFSARDLEIQDVKVKCRGPDDKIYASNPDIQRYIPRGLTLIRSAVDPDGSGDNIDFVIFANRKFTGGIGDEDELQPDTDDEWKKTFLQDPADADLIVSTEKVNGEAAHFSGRFIDGQFYIFTGSKNVHMMISREEDIECYTGQRYSTAAGVAKSVIQALSALEEPKRLLLQQFLHFTQATLACELLQPQYQHIVCLDHLADNQLKVIALYIIPPSLKTEVNSLTVLPVHLLLELLRTIGLQTPDHELLPPPYDITVQQHKDQVRRSYNSEGKVLYYMVGHRTIGLCKLKTAWYIILRSIREKVTWGFFKMEKERSFTLDDLKRASAKRIREIQSWLKLSDKCVSTWIALSGDFMQWLLLQRRSAAGVGGYSNEHLRPTFPRIWLEFLTHASSISKTASGAAERRISSKSSTATAATLKSRSLKSSSPTVTAVTERKTSQAEALPKDSRPRDDIEIN